MNENFKLKYLFPTTIYEAQLNFVEYKQAMIDRTYSLHEAYPNKNSSWRCDTWSTVDVYDIQTDSIFQPLIFEIANHIARFAQEFKVEENRKIVCGSSWVNISKPGDYQEYHMHHNSHFSCIYYIEFPKNSGNTVFKGPAADGDMFPPDYSVPNEVNIATYSVKPEEDKLIVFRSNVQHMVEKNKSDQDRITISANFRVE